MRDSTAGFLRALPAPMSLSRRVIARARATRSSLLGALLVTVLVFPVFLVDVGWGLDQSWAAALHMAVHNDMAFGRDVVFTYGPLGYLAVPYMYFPLQGTVALLMRVPLLLAVAYFLVTRLRRVLPWPVTLVAASPLAWTAGSVMLGGGETVIVPVLVMVGLWVSHFACHDKPVPEWCAAAAGVAAGLLLLCKFDMGLISLAFSSLGLLGDHLAFRGRLAEVARRCGVQLASFVVTVVFVWVVIGQPLGTLSPWLRQSWQVFIGFNDAMAASYGLSWERPMAIVVAAGIGLLALDRSRGFAPRRRFVLVTFTALVLAAFAKQAFVRHDSHSLRFHAVVVLASVALVHPGTRRLALLVAAPAVVAAMAVVGEAPFLHPRDSLSMVRRVGELTVSSSERMAVINWGHKAIPVVYPIPQTMIDTMRGHTAHIEPVQAVVAWVYPDITWRPLPVFQSYSAYTPLLDRLNAAMYRSDDGPEYVLYENAAIDGRVARWESPEAMLAFVCRYDPVETSAQWQLFRRSVPGPAGRCGASRPLGVVNGRRGEPLALPVGGPNDLVVARFDGPGLHRSLLGRAKSLLTRPALYTVSVAGDPVTHRVVTANRRQPHIIAMPACLLGRLGTFDTSAMTSLTFATTTPPKPGPAIRATVEVIEYRCS